MPGADDLMMRVYAATGAEGAGADQRAHQGGAGGGTGAWGGAGRGRGWRPPAPPCARSAAQARREGATRVAHRLLLEVEALRAEGVTSATRPWRGR